MRASGGVPVGTGGGGITARFGIAAAGALAAPPTFVPGNKRHIFAATLSKTFLLWLVRIRLPIILNIPGIIKNIRARRTEAVSHPQLFVSTISISVPPPKGFDEIRNLLNPYFSL
jgi:hypothetical protein